MPVNLPLHEMSVEEKLQVLEAVWADLSREPVSGHFEPASNDRNDPATINCVSRHFSSKQTRSNSFVSGLFERKMPLLS
jgi:hypothetical protein